jgi:hypothetical protein
MCMERNISEGLAHEHHMSPLMARHECQESGSMVLLNGMRLRPLNLQQDSTDNLERQREDRAERVTSGFESEQTCLASDDVLVYFYEGCW